MTSIKIKFRPSTIADAMGTICYQITHERKVRSIMTEFQIFNNEWNNDRSALAISRNSARKRLLLHMNRQMHCELERLNRIIVKLDKIGLMYTVDDIVNEFYHYINEYSLFTFMQHIIDKQKSNGQVRTAETYVSALSSFKKFRHGEDVMLDCITTDLIEDYEAWLKRNAKGQNTISFYNRILRAVYNRAVDKEIIENSHPFRHVYTGVDKTVKRALSIDIIKKIMVLDLSGSRHMDLARDMFMMSFYLRGMSFIDMAYLRKTDLKNGYVTYRRRKTGQQLTIKWVDEMQTIIDKYQENATEYLLPIICKQSVNERSVYRNMGYNINHNLKKIAKMINLDMPLTLYVARHSWASVAKSQGIPISVISEGMGHDSEITTQIYLASLDTSVVDRANSLIIKSLL